MATTLRSALLGFLLLAAPATAQELPRLTTPAPLNLSLLLPHTRFPAIKIPSRDSRKQRIIRASLLVIGAGLDIHSTRRAMGQPELHEAHAFLYGPRAPLWRLLVVKSAINGLTWWGSNKAADRDPVDGVMAVMPQAIWQTYAAVQNYRLVGRIKLAKGGR